ncbi:hypothetical protein QP185_02180 [Sphingomonas aerolata]|uniref:hypothetical protein n=1 Tax=Sphingomonas aerolata TaxID=185951 RepID=UPI002FE33154
MLRFGPDAGPRVIAVLPLFEEANRTRAFLVETLRALAGRGIGSILPDLPGTGECGRDARPAFARPAPGLCRARRDTRRAGLRGHDLERCAH